MSSSKIITLLLLGVAGGILIAPSRGSETRRKLSKLVNDVSDSMQDIIELFCDGTEDEAGKEAGSVENTFANQ